MGLFPWGLISIGFISKSHDNPTKKFSDSLNGVNDTGEMPIKSQFVNITQ